MKNFNTQALNALIKEELDVTRTIIED